MTRWQDVVDSAPEFAAQARTLFDAYRHKTIATLRKDGSPRISGIEAQFQDGELWLGMMAGSMKARDVLRDNRLALHSGSADPPDDPTTWQGDAKLSGRAIPVDDRDRMNSLGGDGSGEGHLFKIDIEEIVVTKVGDPPDHLVISLWRQGQPLRETKRH